jgi:glycine/D-amino acid oxidase-like deaminating enzyme
MHQPRNTHKSQIAKSFSRSTMNPDGANIIYDAMSFNLNHHQLEAYIEKINHRFPNLGKPVYAGGYQSFFDITPDLQFILGPDTSFPNLFHCLGAGQGLKYAPLFGELIAELILDRQALNLEFDSSEFAISRFNPAAAINQTQNNKLFT